jgi:hypothetical protein
MPVSSLLWPQGSSPTLWRQVMAYVLYWLTEVDRRSISKDAASPRQYRAVCCPTLFHELDHILRPIASCFRHGGLQSGFGKAAA